MRQHKLLLIALIILLCTTFGYALAPKNFSCFQEFANISTTCGGLNTGTYNFTESGSGQWINKNNLVDGNYNTFATFNVFNNVDLYINYSIPTSINSAIWTVKDETNTSLLNIPFSCLNSTDSKLKLKIRLEQGGSTSLVKYSCWNGSFFEIVAKDLGNKENLYEEAITWYTSYGVDNCTNIYNLLTNATALTFNFFEENNLTIMNADSVQGTINYANDSFTFSKTNVNNLSICIYPKSLNLSASLYFQYNKAEIEKFYASNLTLNNQTKIYNLYNFNTATGLSRLKITSNNYYYAAYPNVIGVLERYYPSTNIWNAVQYDKSDNQGQLLYWVYQNSVDYRIRWLKDGQLLQVTDPMKFVCDSTSDCSQILSINEGQGTDIFKDMSWSKTYNNNTGIYSLTWYDSSLKVSTVRLLVQQLNPNNAITICDQTLSASSGTLYCNISAYNGIINIEAYRDDPDSFFGDKIEKLVTTLAQALKTSSSYGEKDGIVLSFFLGVTTIGLGLVNPFLLVIGVLLSYVFIWMLGILSIVSFVTLTGMVCLGIIILFMTKRGFY